MTTLGLLGLRACHLSPTVLVQRLEKIRAEIDHDADKYERDEAALQASKKSK